MSDDLFWPAPADDAAAATYAQTEQLERPVEHGSWEPPRPPRQRPTWLVPAMAAGAAALIFGGAGIGIGASLEGSNGGASTNAAGFNVSDASSSTLSASPKSYAGIAAHVLPSVVSINVSGSGQQDTGSGVILRSDGYILTNNHVVAAATNGGTVSVVFNDGSTSSARIVGTDQEDDL
ncbi:MAG TPA: trypsin-like peptidase domain-containing protein, partial [Micromonosporaceae bacterium]